jgi:hypothetical protein
MYFNKFIEYFKGFVKLFENFSLNLRHSERSEEYI